MSSYMERRREGLLGGNSWILAPGLTWNDVAAAYLFAGRGDAGNRRRSIAPGDPYPLTLSGASLTDGGLLVSSGNAKGGNNTSLNGQPIRSIIIAATGVPSSGMMMLAWPKGSFAANGYGLASGVAMSYIDGGEAVRKSRNGASVLNTKCYYYSNTRFTRGILGCSGTSALYINGSKVTTYDNDTVAGDATRRCAASSGMTVGCRWDSTMSGTNSNGGSFTCKAALFYTAHLTAAQHSAIAARLTAMLGL